MSKMIAVALMSMAGALAALPSPASAYTQEQQMACQDDAFRVCGEFIPDEQRVRGCMVAKKAQLSAGCRAQFKDDPAPTPVKASASKKPKHKTTAN
jgi:hypothetical protein